MPAELIEFWRRAKLTGAPYMHCEDRPILTKYSAHINDRPTNFSSYVNDDRFGDEKDRRLHLSLYPAPYGGNLSKADIFILLLNPGFSHSDYYAETRSCSFRSQLEKNLNQDLDDVDFPFISLDPEFCWHSGFNWWERKLRKVIRIVADERFNCRYLDAMRHISNRLAVVELMPYHSISFNSHKLLDKLPSVIQARKFVTDSLLPAAERREKTVIVTRQVDSWGLAEAEEFVAVYKKGQTRGASLGPETPGGRAILKCYGIA